MKERSTNSIEISQPDKTLEAYEILQNFPFSSETKRMGMIAKKKSSGEILFFVKGADSVIMEMVSMEDKIWIQEEAGNLSKEGLRTLAFVYKKIT